MLEETSTHHLTQRVPPNSERLERLVIGNMLVDSDCLRTGLELLTSKDFYAPIRAEIFEKIQQVASMGKGVDTALVLEALKHSSCPHTAAWDEVEACSAQPLTPDIEPHCKELRRRAEARAVLRACWLIIQEGYEQVEDFSSYLDRAEQRFAEAVRSRMDDVVIDTIGDAAARAYAEMDERARNPRPLLGTPTGLYDLDRLLGGLRPAQMYVIASRPGMGKSALAMQVSEQFARRGRRVAFFSLEMSAEELALRAIAANCGLDSRTLSTGEGLAKQLKHVASAVNGLQIPIQLPRSRRLTIETICRIARREHRQHGGLGCVVVDYLQLVAPRQIKGRNREQEVAEISRELKLLAVELQVPVLALSQLNRSVEARTDRRPQLSDLRESGAIEQDADVVMFLNRPDPEQQGDQIDSEIIVAKQRGGPTGTVKAVFLVSVTRYINWYK